MQQVKKDRIFQYGERVLYAGFFLAAFLLCSRISYSDGDDAYFYSMAHSMPFFEYLQMRYVGWEGRMTSEAMTYIAFYFGKTFWQFVNAVILTLLPGGLVHILKKMAGGMTPRKSFFLALAVCLCIMCLGIETIGYGAFWITGSTFYLWSIVAGIWGAMPFVDLVYRKEAATKKSFLYALPCGFIAAMGQEQIAAVVIAFGVLAVVYDFFRKKPVAGTEQSAAGMKSDVASMARSELAGDKESGSRKTIPWLHLLELMIMIAALVVLFISPGTEARSQSEIETWMPQYSTMSLGNHIFITVQWMLSSFANEGKMLFALLWIIVPVLLWQRKNIKSRILAVLSGIAAAIALLPYIGITVFSEMGMGVTDITQCVEQVATPDSVTGQNRLAMLWWLAAILFTLVLLWQVEERLRDKVVMCLCILAACASEAIMFFSPTMYASGARVYFMAQILLWLVIGRMCEKVFRQNREIWPVVLVAAAGAVNVISGVALVAMYL